MENQFPKLSADQPIETSEDDALNRDGFASRLASAIQSYPGEEALVMGLYGKWGSGKSSIKNMLLEHLRSASEQQPMVLEFNPWRLTGEDQLLRAFFSEIRKLFEGAEVSLGGASKERERKLAAKRAALWAKYERIVTVGAVMAEAGSMATTGVPIGSVLAKPVGWIKSLTKAGKEEATDASQGSTESIEDVHNQLKEEFSTERFGRKVLVVIDDVDRLSNAEICLLIRLVKANADFPGFVFLLLCDDERVAEALEHEAGKGKGLSYLEKIVQICFRVPMASGQDLEQFFFNQLNAILDSLGGTESGVWSKKRDVDRFGQALRNVLLPYMTSFRAMKRYFNGLGLALSAFLEEGRFNANPVDIFLLEALRIFEPGAYQALHSSDRWVLLGADLGFLVEEDNSKETVDEIVRAGASDEKVKRALELLFPEVGAGRESYGITAESQWRDHLRVCSPDCFSRYFELGLRGDDLRENEFSSLLEEGLGQDEARMRLDSASCSGRLGAVVARLEVSEEFLMLSDPIPVLAALWEIGGKIPTKPHVMDSLDGYSRAMLITDRYLRAEKDRDRRQAFVDALLSKIAPLSARLFIVSHLEQDFSEGDQIGQASLWQPWWERTRDSYVLELRSSSQDTVISAANEWNIVLGWWHLNDPENATKFLAAAIEAPLGLKALLGLCAGTITGRKVTRYVRIGAIEEYLPLAQVEAAASHHAGTTDEKLASLLKLFEAARQRRAEGKPEDIYSLGE